MARRSLSDEASGSAAAGAQSAAAGRHAFMSVRQVAEYLSLNQKTVYALVNEGRIPGTKVTGKWIFPRELVDRWLLESSHGGALTDRLLLAGSDDPLLGRVIARFAQELRGHALVSYGSTGTRIGLELLQANRVDAACMHWGPAAESRLRHPALLHQYPQHTRWVLVHAFRREQGLMLGPLPRALRISDTGDGEDRFRALSETLSSTGRGLRWAMRQEGSGSQRYLREILARARVEQAELAVAAMASTDREAASKIAMGEADLAPGPRAAATEFGLGFVAFGWESFDIALRRDIYFRRMFQELLARLKNRATALDAQRLGGYDLTDSGRLLIGHD